MERGVDAPVELLRVKTAVRVMPGQRLHDLIAFRIRGPDMASR
jgi:hypothetical protein